MIIKDHVTTIGHIVLSQTSCSSAHNKRCLTKQEEERGFHDPVGLFEISLHTFIQYEQRQCSAVTVSARAHFTDRAPLGGVNMLQGSETEREISAVISQQTTSYKIK